MLVQDKRPTEEMIKKAYETNSHGAGIAWKRNDAVIWRKGLDLDEIKRMAKSVPTPYVLHFRIASVGGQAKQLCHPFPIEEEAPLATEGKTKGYVLFHNGHWGKWRDTLLEHLPGKIPAGKWSDTRAMAWMTAYYGLGFLEFVDEKAIAFGPGGFEVFKATDWTTIEGVYCSNSLFQYRTHRYHGAHVSIDPICTFGNCTVRSGLDSDKRCKEHPLVPKGLEATVSGQKDGNTDSSKAIDIQPLLINGVANPKYRDPQRLADAVAAFGGPDLSKGPVVGSFSPDARLRLQEDKSESGGTRGMTPFAIAQQLFNAGKLSKGELKKARKAQSKLDRQKQKLLMKAVKKQVKEEKRRLKLAQERMQRELMTQPCFTKH
jgi:hypothetical protein